MFINPCQRFPALFAALEELAGVTTLPVAAQRVLVVLPRADSPLNRGNLNQLVDKDKEDACFASKLREETRAGTRIVRRHMGFDWDWGWWTGRLREEGLYNADDAGLGGLADQLQTAYQAWEAKKAQVGERQLSRVPIADCVEGHRR